MQSEFHFHWYFIQQLELIVFFSAIHTEIFAEGSIEFYRELRSYTVNVFFD